MSEFPKSRLSFFLHFISQQKLFFFLVCFSCLASSLSTSLWPVVTGKLIDAINQYVGDKNNILVELSNVFLSVLGFLILLEVLTRFHGLVLAKIYPTLEANVRMQVFRYVNQHSHGSRSAQDALASAISALRRLPFSDAWLRLVGSGARSSSGAAARGCTRTGSATRSCRRGWRRWSPT